MQKAETTVINDRIQAEKMRRKELRQPCDCLVELGFDVCFQQQRYPRVGQGLKDAGRGLKDAGRGLQKSGDLVIGTSTDREKQNLTTDEHG